MCPACQALSILCSTLLSAWDLQHIYERVWVCRTCAEVCPTQNRKTLYNALCFNGYTILFRRPYQYQLTNEGKTFINSGTTCRLLNICQIFMSILIHPIKEKKRSKKMMACICKRSLRAKTYISSLTESY